MQRRAIIGILLSGLVFSGCTFKSRHEPPNTLHLPVQEKVKGLDPIYADDLYAGDEVGRAYEALLQYQYLKRPYALEPGLAEAMPSVSPDRKTFTFKLKKGVLFQDDPCFKDTGGKGREMTADDVVYSFKRLADPKNNSPGWWIFDGRIVGLNAWHDESAKAGATDYSKPIEGLKAIDRYTLQLKLVTPSEQFMYLLAMPFASVVPHEAVESYGKEFINHAVGTGPFRLSEFNGSSKIIWVKNPTYRLEYYPSQGEPADKEAGLLADAGKPLPMSDMLVDEVFEESQPMWLNFLKGTLDSTSIPKDDFQQAITPSKELSPDIKEKGIRLMKYPELDVTYTAFNMKDPLLGKNKLLRQALSLAYDEVPYIEKFYNGRAIPAQGPIPPGISGYDPSFKNPYRQFNLAKAKEYLAKAGYPDGKGLPELVFANVSDTTSRQSAEYEQLMFSAIGVKLRIDQYSWPEFTQAIKNGRAQMWSMAWSADYPDGENFLQLFYSKNGTPGPNDSNYSNPEFDQLYEKALSLPLAERTDLYKRMVKIVTEDCPWIFHAHRLGYPLVQRWLKNYKPNDFDHTRPKYYRVDSTLKK